MIRREKMALRLSSPPGMNQHLLVSSKQLTDRIWREIK